VASSSSTRRPWRWLPLAALPVSAAWAGCTLTADPFEPGLVDRNQLASTPDAPAPPPAAEPAPTEEAPSPPSPVESAGGEAEAEAVPLDPTEVDDAQLGGNEPAVPVESAPQPEPIDAGADASGVPSPVATDAGAESPVVDVAASCPGEVFEGSCYEFFDDLVAWVDAEESCLVWGGHLASVESSGENSFLNSWPGAVSGPAANGPGIWLGGTDAEDDGEFVWPDGTALDFDAFAPSQPDNGIGVDCIEKRNDPTGLWSDQRCTDQRPYVCERPLLGVPAP